MEPPIGFITLRDAADAVGRRLHGNKWCPIAQTRSDTIICKLDPEIDRVIKTLAEQCETGGISAAYRSITGADGLDQAVWQMPHWRNYFATGTIDLDLPLLDNNLRPNPNGYTARCTREVFIRRADLDRWVATLPAPPLAHRGLRYPSDEPLIQEALQAIADGRVVKPLQAAKLVYQRAEGPSPNSNLDRLRKLIADEVKAQSSPIVAKPSPTP
jgi:hypothetical protein